VNAPRRAAEEDIVEPAPCPPDEPHHIFRRGKHYPRAIAWLGFKSFWGHLWHLAASVIATEDIDARDWMKADAPDELTGRIAQLLGSDDGDAPSVTSLVERLDRDLWIDFIADTGDDRDVSAAMAEMLFRQYRIAEDGLLPRGDILLFGGDTAYPVATDVEIHNRVCVPFNRVLRKRQDGKMRILLGIPGNHDWYDGLDGFARMFRARRGSVARTSVSPDDSVEHRGQLDHLVEWVEAFRVGKYVAKRSALPLMGYVPVQGASYFALRLAPHLDLWAVDRQLRAVDYTQQAFFNHERAEAPERGLLLMLADPAYAMLEPYRIGQATLAQLELSLEEDGPLVLAGDTHHYCRQHFGSAMHVIAGGGGAFLHPARIQRQGFTPPEAEFPGPRACFALAMQVPWQIAAGRAGFIVHTAALLIYLPLLGLELLGHSILIGSVIVGALATMTCALLGGWRNPRRWIVRPLALLCGTWVGALPWASQMVIGWLAGDRLGATGFALSAYALSIYPAVLGFGAFLMVLTLLGLEQHQAFSALAHPGYKHFVRLRVRRDGSAVDGWIIGKIDTLDPDSPVVLVDRWTWKNRRGPGNEE
jgi:hypothetical protein